MKTEKTKNQKFTTKEENISLAFPEDREAYMLKLMGLVALAAFIVWVVLVKSKDDNIFVTALISLIVFSFLVVVYEKIVFFLKVDTLAVADGSLNLYYKNKLLHTYPIVKLGLKIAHDINGVDEISIYDLSENKKIFHCKGNEVDKNDLKALLLQLQKISDMDSDIITKGTYGEVIPLVVDFNDMSHGDSLTRYYDKYYFYNLSGYGWLIYPFVVIVVLATLYFIN